eukprot:171178-Amphidinium_carterae.1
MPLAEAATKVDELEVIGRSRFVHKVFELQVPMRDALVVEVVYCQQHLVHSNSSIALLRALCV